MRELLVRAYHSPDRVACVNDVDDQSSVQWFLDMGGFAIGAGHYLAWDHDGDLYWLCPNCRGLGTIDVTSGTRHAVVSKDPLTIEGSLLCVRCKAHGFVRDGRWVPLPA